MPVDIQSEIPLAIDRISNDRAAQKSAMQADLMRPAGKRMKFKQSMLLERFECVIFTDRFPPFPGMLDGHLLSMTRVAPDRCLHAASWRGGSAVHQGKIGLVHCSQTELVLKPAMGAFIFSKHDQTGSLFI